MATGGSLNPYAALSGLGSGLAPTGAPGASGLAGQSGGGISGGMKGLTGMNPATAAQGPGDFGVQNFTPPSSGGFGWNSGGGWMPSMSGLTQGALPMAQNAFGALGLTMKPGTYQPGPYGGPTGAPGSAGPPLVPPPHGYPTAPFSVAGPKKPSLPIPPNLAFQHHQAMLARHASRMNPMQSQFNPFVQRGPGVR